MAQLDLLSDVCPPPPVLTMRDTPPEKTEAKADGAYRTIREVSEEIDVPQHVLRFWESRFPQIKPSRMRGARRYYRPQDVETLKTIKTLLYSKGYTIKGAKKVVSGKTELPASKTKTPVQATASSKKPSRSPETIQSLVSELRVLKSMLTSLL